MARKPTNIDPFAKILIEKDLPSWQRPCPGEMTYVSVAADLIQKQLKEYYGKAGLQPPQVGAIRRWFYFGCPDWAIAVLCNIVGVNVDARDMVVR